jgi:hypothetical protein
MSSKIRLFFLLGSIFAQLACTGNLNASEIEQKKAEEKEEQSLTTHDELDSEFESKKTQAVQIVEGMLAYFESMDAKLENLLQVISENEGKDGSLSPLAQELFQRYYSANDYANFQSAYPIVKMRTGRRLIINKDRQKLAVTIAGSKKHIDKIRKSDRTNIVAAFFLCKFNIAKLESDPTYISRELIDGISLFQFYSSALTAASQEFMSYTLFDSTKIAFSFLPHLPNQILPNFSPSCYLEDFDLDSYWNPYSEAEAPGSPNTVSKRSQLRRSTLRESIQRAGVQFLKEAQEKEAEQKAARDNEVQEKALNRTQSLARSLSISDSTEATLAVQYSETNLKPKKRTKRSLSKKNVWGQKQKDLSTSVTEASSSAPIPPPSEETLSSTLESKRPFLSKKRSLETLEKLSDGTYLERVSVQDFQNLVLDFIETNLAGGYLTTVKNLKRSSGNDRLVITQDVEQSFFLKRFDGKRLWFSVHLPHGRDGNNRRMIPKEYRKEYLRLFTAFDLTPDSFIGIGEE